MSVSDRVSFAWLAAAGLCLAPLACSLLYPVSNLEGSPVPSDASSEASAADAGSGEASAGCQGSAGPTAVRVQLDGGSFCVDTTEVTKADYAAFLSVKEKDLGGQPPECAANTSYVPSQDWPIVAGDESLPVAYIDWCDARAFCAWAGKRLCGSRVDAFVTRDEWLVACSRDATRTYPYGNQYDPNACNGDNRVGKTTPVGSLPGCVGGYDGLFDMSGNVSEWTADCDDAGVCLHKGGGYSTTDGATKIACAAFGGIGRMENYSSVGIRCCAD